jgi:hypothetical protein
VAELLPPRRLFGIDLVHTVEFSRIGRPWLRISFPSGRLASIQFVAPSAAFGVETNPLLEESFGPTL